MKKNVIGLIILLLILLALLLPIALYVYKFGFVLSADHQRWAELGSAFSGIYSPIIAFLALLILVRQFRSQVESNKHQFDQTYIESTRNDINFFLEKIEKALKDHTKAGITTREYLFKYFAFLNKEQLNEQSLKDLAKEFRNDHRIILDMWIAIYPLLRGLDANKFYPYEHNLTSAILRITCTLSIETCVAIDNFYYVATNDIGKGKYYFTKEI